MEKKKQNRIIIQHPKCNKCINGKKEATNYTIKHYTNHPTINVNVISKKKNA